jgi:hypothetical protein
MQALLQHSNRTIFLEFLLGVLQCASSGLGRSECAYTLAT